MKYNIRISQKQDSKHFNEIVDSLDVCVACRRKAFCYVLPRYEEVLHDGMNQPIAFFVDGNDLCLRRIWVAPASEILQPQY